MKIEHLQQYDEQQGQFAKTMPNKRNFGNNILIWRKPNGQPRYMLGPHYLLFIIALILSIFLLVLLLYSIKDVVNTFLMIVMIGCSLGFVFSYINVGLSLPGIASNCQEPSLEQRSLRLYCAKCKIVRNHKTYHCEDCDVCIIGYDHHCPWVGKCIGADNLTAFYIFLVMTFGTLVMYFIASIISRDNLGNQKILT